MALKNLASLTPALRRYPLAYKQKYISTIAHQLFHSVLSGLY